MKTQQPTFQSRHRHDWQPLDFESQAAQTGSMAYECLECGAIKEEKRPFDSRPQKKGREFEKRLKKEGGGKRMPGSGAGVLKHDYEENGWLIEAKSTKHRSFSVKAELMQSIKREAAMRGLLPRLEIELDNGQNQRDIYIVVPKSTFIQLLPEPPGNS